MLFATIANSLFSQTIVNMGEILVSKNFAAILNFPDSIIFVAAANNPPTKEGKSKYYEIVKTQKICLLRANDTLAPETSIDIKTQHGLYYGFLKYMESKKHLYNFDNDSSKRINEKEISKVVSVKSKETLIKERLNSLLSEPVEYKSIGTIENGMTFQVGNIKNDENNTYFKLIIKNETGGDYNIDGIYFKYVEGKTKGIKRKDAKIEARLKIEFESPLKIVKAYTTEELGYIIERFSGSKKGSLIIQFRELNGTKSPIIEISGDKMLNIKVFEQKL